MLKHLQASTEWSKKSVAQKGFTLIELLVVIVILGILAAVAIFAIGGINDKAETNACKTEVTTVETAWAAWVAQNDGAVPGSFADLYSASGNLKKSPTHVASGDLNLATGEVSTSC